ncbi:PPC domain-containing protein [Pseudoalteromonas denitrificans]|uniref:Pre-peptidase C-terminal domain-containing protein n=1 Tax=Pseudoalteromonas denitrificans DSM 6059 TaxID=1123010 RepID=A0A1I1UN93_9GAMM|nr:PPC domain-containing protein [Pseudoalteromonas denitrificans]SFD72045.1 pre-peptidase C-terminal domain-containing protein [Pseudoalteromonas denitrificans DSM 6059]
MFKIKKLATTLIGLFCSAAFMANANEYVNENISTEYNNDEVSITGPMNVSTYQSLAGRDQRRCMGGAIIFPKRYLDYALSQNIITRGAYNWGINEGFYPVIDRNDRVGAVCAFDAFPPLSIEYNNDEVSINAIMDLSVFKAKAGKDTQRCIAGIGKTRANQELDYALSKNIITSRAYDWGLSNGFYPVIDRNDRVAAVCAFDEFPPLSGDTGSEQHFKLYVPSGQNSLKISILGNNGDADLYIKHGNRAQQNSYDCASEDVGSNDSCQINNPVSGTWHILVYGYHTFSDVKLISKFD